MLFELDSRYFQVKALLGAAVPLRPFLQVRKLFASRCRTARHFQSRRECGLARRCISAGCCRLRSTALARRHQDTNRRGNQGYRRSVEGAGTHAGRCRDDARLPRGRSGEGRQDGFQRFHGRIHTVLWNQRAAAFAGAQRYAGRRAGRPHCFGGDRSHRHQARLMRRSSLSSTGRYRIAGA